MATIRDSDKTDRRLCVCSYEDRPEAMDSLILMGESLCCVDPEVVLSTMRPEGVTGWDVKPWLLLQELNTGKPEVLWLDDDMIVTRPISSMLKEFPHDSLIVAEEWDGTEAAPLYRFWGMPFGRRLPSINACVIRATPAHRPLLNRYLQMTQHPRYREAQTLPIANRPIPVLGDTPLLIALLESKEFCGVSFDYLRLGQHIAQCAGSSGYRPHHRLFDLFRGLPPLIHCIGRKPWVSIHDRGRLHRFLIDLATDVSPYVLAARRVARHLDMDPAWLDTRTLLGRMMCELTAYHPALAGLPLSSLHAFHIWISGVVKFRERKAEI